jgi:hypothetical protein
MLCDNAFTSVQDLAGIGGLPEGATAYVGRTPSRPIMIRAQPGKRGWIV